MAVKKNPFVAQEGEEEEEASYFERAKEIQNQYKTWNGRVFPQIIALKLTVYEQIVNVHADTCIELR